MSGGSELSEWRRVLDVTSSEDAVVELRRYQYRLQRVWDELQETLYAMWSAPGEVDAILLIARSCVGEGIDALAAVIRQLDRDDPGVA